MAPKNNKIIDVEQKEVLYDLYLDDKKIDYYIIKIKNFSDKYKYLVSANEIQFRRGFVFSNQKGMNTMFFKVYVDIVIVDSNDVVIKLLKSFKPNRFSNYYEGSKFVYVFPENTIEYMNFKINSELKIRKAKKVKW